MFFDWIYEGNDITPRSARDNYIDDELAIAIKKVHLLLSLGTLHSSAIAGKSSEKSSWLREIYTFDYSNLGLHSAAYWKGTFILLPPSEYIGFRFSNYRGTPLLPLLLFVTDTQEGGEGNCYSERPRLETGGKRIGRNEKGKKTPYIKTWDVREHICGGEEIEGGRTQNFHPLLFLPLSLTTRLNEKRRRVNGKMTPWKSEHFSVEGNKSPLFGNVFSMLPKQTNKDLNI